MRMLTTAQQEHFTQLWTQAQSTVACFVHTSIRDPTTTDRAVPQPMIRENGEWKLNLSVAQPCRPRMSETAVIVAIHRLRGRFRELIRGEIATTVKDPADVADELRPLIAVAGSS